MRHVGDAAVPAAVAGGEQRESAYRALRLVQRDFAEARDFEPAVDLRIAGRRFFGRAAACRVASAGVAASPCDGMKAAKERKKGLRSKASSGGIRVQGRHVAAAAPPCGEA
jgi:hypothetical protein